jgi:predicted HTH domain antitoxin
MMDNIAVVIGIVTMIAVAVYAVYYFFNLEKSKQLEIVQEWLLLAVVQAEKELGGGTGQIKLRYVYDLFLSKFSFLSKIITFNQFSSLVDMALMKMNDMLQGNVQLKEYVEE